MKVIKYSGQYYELKPIDGDISELIDPPKEEESGEDKSTKDSKKNKKENKEEKSSMFSNKYVLATIGALFSITFIVVLDSRNMIPDSLIGFMDLIFKMIGSLLYA